MTDMPNVAEMDVPQIVDALGSVREIAKEAKKREGFLKEALLARAKEGNIMLAEGHEWTAVITAETQSRLDTELIRKDMSEEWIQDHSKGIEFFKVTTKRN